MGRRPGSALKACAFVRYWSSSGRDGMLCTEMALSLAVLLSCGARRPLCSRGLCMTCRSRGGELRFRQRANARCRRPESVPALSTQMRMGVTCAAPPGKLHLGALLHRHSRARARTSPTGHPVVVGCSNPTSASRPDATIGAPRARRHRGSARAADRAASSRWCCGRGGSSTVARQTMMRAVCAGALEHWGTGLAGSQWVYGPGV